MPLGVRVTRTASASCLIAPDEYCKYLQSGGGPYAIPLQGIAADVPLRHEWHRTTFVNYLRVSLR